MIPRESASALANACQEFRLAKSSLERIAFIMELDAPSRMAQLSTSFASTCTQDAVLKSQYLSYGSSYVEHEVSLQIMPVFYTFGYKQT